MAKKKAPWGMIVMTLFVAFCLLPIGLWFSAYKKGQRDYEQTEAEWDQLFSELVEQRATVEEVKSAIRAKGKEPYEEMPEKLYDGSMRRHSVGTEFYDLEPAAVPPRALFPIIYFDEDGVAVDYETTTG